MQRNLPSLASIASMLAVSLLCGSAQAQDAGAGNRPVNFDKDGVRFEIKAAIRALPESATYKRSDDKHKASLEVKLRISAHATEADFFGAIAQSFQDFRVADGSGEKLFMSEPRCHQRRGLPKVTVVAIDGSVETDKGHTDIAARPRQLGRVLPSDEISAGSRQPASGKAGNVITYTSQTRTSGLTVDVNIYSIDCPLAGTP